MKFTYTTHNIQDNRSFCNQRAWLAGGVAYRGVHDARPMCADGVGNMADVDGIQMLVV